MEVFRLRHHYSQAPFPIGTLEREDVMRHALGDGIVGN